MKKVALSFCVGAGLLALSAAASAEVITFSGLPGTGFPPLTSPYTEGNFTVTPGAGQYYAGDAFGNPRPDLFEYSGSATIAVTENGGSDFTFNSIDLANYTSDAGSYLITGSLGGSLAFTEAGTIGGTGTFSSFAGMPETIDTLTITLTNALGESDLDNIDVTAVAAATPEPSSLMLLGSGLLGVVGLMRRRLA